MRTRIKFCGITCATDAQAAAAAGADALGLVFYPPSPSAINIADAANILPAIPPFVEVIALLVNAAEEEVNHIIQQVRPSCLQFHGDEDAQYCRSFGLPYIKACRVQHRDDIVQTMREHDTARGILLDSKNQKQYGGSGKSFDWRLIPANNPKPLIVAGGLSAQTVGALIRTHRPWAVDVSGGIAADDCRRRKDCDKMNAFIQQVQRADNA